MHSRFIQYLSQRVLYWLAQGAETWPFVVICQAIVDIKVDVLGHLYAILLVHSYLVKVYLPVSRGAVDAKGLISPIYNGYLEAYLVFFGVDFALVWVLPSFNLFLDGIFFVKFRPHHIWRAQPCLFQKRAK